jgi:hypothetical protein
MLCDKCKLKRVYKAYLSKEMHTYHAEKSSVGDVVDNDFGDSSLMVVVSISPIL